MGITDEAGSGEILLQIEDLTRYFVLSKKRILKAVDGVSFSIRRGETFGLVGESGCGKSTLGRTVVGLYKPTRGRIMFKGNSIHGDIDKISTQQLSRQMQMIFQDPYTSLNPRMKVNDIIAEGIDNHHMAANSRERNRMVAELLLSVGLDEEHAGRYPHEFSGGQRQRIGIARALAVNPDFIIADEPISALDVSIQAQVVNLLKSLQTKHNLTYMFIAHDLSMVRYISDHICVMYLGRIMELAETEKLFQQPLHPYTMALLSSIPIPDPDEESSRRRIELPGSVQSPINPGEGCRFFSRCSRATAICEKETPPLTEPVPGHFTACHNLVL
ncbi:MAG: ABC transporter ATP-binding protein [Treponema sp.]|nr:ABC transporter ATP-binding protein [Treponema sp.]